MSHNLYMQKCIELAQNGIGKVAPNPLVGSILVADDEIIGQGFHQKYGEAHAEVHAISSVQDQARLREATLYVNLEPCSHYGKTPPCADLIIQNEIPRVVIGNIDTNPEIAGAGIQKLQEAGIDVLSGIEEEACRELNKRFFTFHEQKRPFVILKWAQTSDGFIAREDYSSKWISSETSRTLTHQWRSEEAAILVGTNTALYDNPELTVRLVQGEDPTRIFIDKNKRVPTLHHLYDGSVRTLLFTEETSTCPDTVTALPYSSDLKQLLTYLYDQKILSVLVEGGSKLLQSFIDSGLWDEARIFTAKKSFKAGIKAPALSQSKQTDQFTSGEDTATYYRRES